jgi:8-oxo-dGTP pyrophosphatase MutT (NUDIX family)
LREATEETGIEHLKVVVPAIHLDVHRVEPPREPPHLHYDVRFLVLAPEGAVAVGNHESTALRWVNIDELDALTDEPGLRTLARRALDVARSLS